MDNSFPYKSSLTREAFLFYEMRTTANLMDKGLSEEAIINEIVTNNLYQYPTERSVERMAKFCARRLKSLDNKNLVKAIATETSEVSRQICLYAMMRDSRLVWEFMITVIGEKYRCLDSSFSKGDVTGFLMRLQEQSDVVASWGESTTNKVRQVLTKTLVEVGYLETTQSKTLNQIMLSPVLEAGIIENHDEIVLPVFNKI